MSANRVIFENNLITTYIDPSDKAIKMTRSVEVEKALECAYEYEYIDFESLIIEMSQVILDLRNQLDSTKR